ncbi:MAG: bifunctional hydroxymethylpyrimidine kinase/phosphomethylpyrimidine kinase [Candidatus Nitrosotenuis sp.]
MNVLAIGGSDPSSGAGIQSDIRAAAALGAYCFGVVTAVTSQNSAKFFDVQPVSTRILRMQIDSIISDFAVDAVSIGMVYDSGAIRQIRSALTGMTSPIVIDPVIRSTTGGVLLKKSALAAYRKYLVPLATAITPNVVEAEVLAGTRITDPKSAKDTAKKITEMGAKSVIITGCEFEKNKIIDYVYQDGMEAMVTGRKIDWQTHGSGCNFSFALAYWLGNKKDLFTAARQAKSFAMGAIRSAKAIGRGVRITLPDDVMMRRLAGAIRRFQSIPDAWRLIPEVQTNFVYAKIGVSSVDDIIGVAGRIVRTGYSVTLAGRLEYGGSRHVASAVMAMQEKFPHVRAALNIKYDAKTVDRFVGAGYKVARYDRKKEPARTKKAENHTILWGIKNAIRNLDTAPDAVYHTGDVGKEPMIIVFGTSPSNVLAKLKVLDSK